MKHLLALMALCVAFAAGAQTWNPDADFDNVIGVNDLMALLSVFGSEWTADYPQDPEYDLAAYYAGEMDLMDCVSSCKANNGVVIGFDEYSMFQDSVDVAMGYVPSDVCFLECASGYSCSGSFYRSAYCRNDSDFGYGLITRGGGFSCNGTSMNEGGYNFSLYNTTLQALTVVNSQHCFCAGLVPIIE